MAFVTAAQVNGQFRCYGSLQHLKSRFGKGIALYAKVAAGSDTSAIKNYISAHFAQLEFKGEHAVQDMAPHPRRSPRCRAQCTTLSTTG